MAQLQLNQVIALEKGVKTRAYEAVTKAYHGLQQAPKLSGISRTYRPKDDEGEQLPPESTRVQVRATDLIRQIGQALTRLFDVELTKDVGNQVAMADIVVDDTLVLARDVPVSYLLFLEKQLNDILAFVNKLPVLDPAETWVYSDILDEYATVPSQTIRQKKVPRNHVKAAATDKHPAQVEMYFEDVLVGYWTTTKYSGALPQARVAELKERVVKVAEAVKKAREKANSTVVDDKLFGEQLFEYLFH